MITTVLFDLDGVIRHFDPEVTAEIERRHGIESGTLMETAFAGTAAEELTIGRLRRDEWIAGIGASLGCPAAAEEWGAQRAHLDEDVLALAAELRGRGIRAAILTNGTDGIPAEIDALGLADSFDPIFNSAEIGHAKPDARVFAHVVHALGCTPEEILFTDDTATNVAGAIAAGMRAHHFTDAAGLRRALRTHAIAVA
ncbi:MULTISPECIES: HAD family phosphatase [unclassified Microbacterium]|uniref:HAD family hydrolase n=1 Tax=unclassified Microbacterium TaxID=2609290 RepID=UPI0012F7CB81|nr:HAD family phosphatase [Microbacterium sp. MAH-37]MVQ41881.1 HAD-IA family hydrolase [Microbacterium sp. MAH-37]